MKKLLILVASAALGIAAVNAQYVDLVSFGTSSGFTVDPFSTTATYTQSTTTLNFSPSISLGDTIGGSFDNAPYNWSSYTAATDFAVKISILSGSNPNLPFSLSLVDASSNIINFVGTTVGATTDTYIPLTLNGTDPGNVATLLGVTAGQLTWDGGATANVSVQTIAAVPEPSTYALLALAGVALSGYVARRRRSQC